MKKRNSHKDILDKILEVERSFDVNSLLYRDICIWPFLRYVINAKLNHPKANIYSFIPKPVPISSVLLSKEEENFYYSCSKKIDFIFVSRSSDNTDTFGNKKYNRHIDPYIEFIQKNGNFIKIEKLDHINFQEKIPRFIQTIFVLNNVAFKEQFDYLYNIKTFFNFKEKLYKVSGINEIDEPFILKFFETIDTFQTYFYKILKMINPQVVFLTCFYDPKNIPIILACKRLNIKSVDIQHGKQGKLHPLYTNWSKIPDEGYQLLPDYFWMWGEESKQNILKLRNNYNHNHMPIVGGNLWLSKWTSPHSPFNFSKKEIQFYKYLKTKQKTILVSIQPVENNFPEFLIQTIKNSPDNWLWLLRLHPRISSEEEMSGLNKILSNYDVHNFEIRLSTICPLYELLKHSHHHITMWSSVCYEALAFKVPTTIIDPIGFSIYEKYISQGIFSYARTKEELLNIISNSCYPQNISEKHSYIETSQEIAEKAIEFILNDNSKEKKKSKKDLLVSSINLKNSKQCLIFNTNDTTLVIEKTRELKPDIVWLNELGSGTDTVISSIRPFTQLIVGKVNLNIPKELNIRSFDIIFCPESGLVNQFRNAGITSYYYPNFFESDLYFSYDSNQERLYKTIFIGDLDTISDEYKLFFEYTSKRNLIELWGKSFQMIPETSVIRKVYHGKVSKKDHMSIYNKSKIAINPRIDSNYNKRLFEITGCGALLISEYSNYLDELFKIGKEIIVYRSLDECLDLIKYYQKYPYEAQKIAEAGQKRTLKNHTYEVRIKKAAEILERHLRYNREKKYLKLPKNISHSFKAIQKNQIEARHTKSWQSETIPSKQRCLTQIELDQMYHGKPPIVFHSLAAALYPIIKPYSSVLEIGCSTGYYYEILEYLLNMQINYIGGDYSLPMIQMAKDYYPHVPFYVFDGVSLPFTDQFFTIGISSCVLLHTPNYQEQIHETARVSKKYLIAHRTPICKNNPTTYFTKYAYGVETVELLFNENEFIKEFQKNGFTLKNYITLSESVKDDNYNITFIFKRIKN